MTPPPDKQPAVETPEEIAERVVDENLDTYHYSASRRDLVAACLSALRNERERCAKIAETHSATDCDGPDCGVVIAKAIRASASEKGEMNG